MKSVLLVILLMVSSFSMAQSTIRWTGHAASNLTDVKRTVTSPMSSDVLLRPALVNSTYLPSIIAKIPERTLLRGLLLAAGAAGLLSLVPDYAFLTKHGGMLVLGLLLLFFVVRAWLYGRGNAPHQYDWETYVPEIDAPGTHARIDSAGLQLPLDQHNQLASGVANQTNNKVLIPDFEVSTFVSRAKAHFVVLQTAWDQGDFNRISSFTTPTMFRALRQQAQSVGRSGRHTDVVQLFGTLLQVHTTGKEYVASVCFEGLMKPMPDASAELFSEVWHITRPFGDQTSWALAGIQKIS
jgi:hypothetical protein